MGKVTTWSPLGDPQLSLTQKPIEVGGKVDARLRFASQLVPLLKEGANAVEFTVTGSCRTDSSGDFKTKSVKAAKGSITINVPKDGLEKFYKTVGPKLPKHKLKGGKKLAKTVRKEATARLREDAFAMSTTGKEWRLSTQGAKRVRRVSVVVLTRLRKKSGCRAHTMTVIQKTRPYAKKFEKTVSVSVGGFVPFPCPKK